MPVKIFVVQGDKSIGGLESEINKWQHSLGSKASVTHYIYSNDRASRRGPRLADAIGGNDLV
jgi:hypothetical protein